jgi:hypothetical protein
VVTKSIPHSAFVTVSGGVPMASAKVRDSEPEIDYDRVIWDLDYRRHVVAELNRFHRSGHDRRDSHAVL